MFIPINYDEGKVVPLLMGASKTIVKGDALAFSSGLAQRATSSTAEILYVALESVTSAASGSYYVNAIPTAGVKFSGLTANNTAQSLVGTKVDLTDHDTINDAATTTTVFRVEKIVGAAANKKVEGYFVKKA